MDAIRRPLVISAAVLIALALAVEIGSRFWVQIGPPETERPGLGIASLAAVDVLLITSLAIVAAGALGLKPTVLAKSSGCAITIVAFLTLLACLGLVFVAFGLVMLMVGLLLATPFGTAVYLAAWGHFDRGPASITLGFLMILKLVAALLAFLGNQHALKDKSLILMFLTSIGLTFLLTFLHGLPPRFLVSITDGVGAIVAFVVALIWSIFYLIGGVAGVVKIFRIGERKVTDPS